MNKNTVKQIALAEESCECQEETSYGIYWLLLALSLVFLVLIPDQATWVKTDRGWYTQPMFGCTVGLSVMALFSLIRVAESLRDFSGMSVITLARAFDSLESYRTALVTSFLFFMYIQSLAVLGFMLSTVIFTTLLLWLSRLLDRTWFIANLATVAALIIIFRITLNIWLPDAWLYSLLPDNLADLANQYL